MAPILNLRTFARVLLEKAFLRAYFEYYKRVYMYYGILVFDPRKLRFSGSPTYDWSNAAFSFRIDRSDEIICTALNMQNVLHEKSRILDVRVRCGVCRISISQ